MGEYYVYRIGEDGHIEHRVELICDDDSEAKRLARQLVDGHTIELWQGTRMIERLEPHHPGERE